MKTPCFGASFTKSLIVFWRIRSKAAKSTPSLLAANGKGSSAGILAGIAVG